MYKINDNVVTLQSSFKTAKIQVSLSTEAQHLYNLKKNIV